MDFHAYHGVYPEEQVLGNRFTVDVVLCTNFQEAMLHDRLEGTVDYTRLYQLVKARMEQPVKLLEHLGYTIIQDIRSAYPELKEVQVMIKKHHPALGGLTEFSAVTVSYPEDFA
jgi:dihydroneopterin aldolase